MADRREASPTCDAPTRSSYRSLTCGRPAKHEEGGKHYCGIHNPARKRARKETWERKYAARRELNAAIEARNRLERDAAEWAFAHSFELRQQYEAALLRVAEARDKLEELS